MEPICGNCRYFRDKDGKRRCWITGNEVTAASPACDWNFSVKKSQ